MLHADRWTGAVLTLMAGVSLSACRGQTEAAAAKIAPAHVEHIDGSELSKVTLTPKAAERLDIQTGSVREARVARSGTVRKVVPYAAVLYDANGNTWVYTNPEPLVFLRHSIKVDYIDGDQAVLSDGPALGTQVVTVGGAELFGAEFEIGH
jgi:hypothetical protein